MVHQALFFSSVGFLLTFRLLALITGTPDQNTLRVPDRTPVLPTPCARDNSARLP